MCGRWLAFWKELLEKASDAREEKQRVQRNAWELVAKTEADGDRRGSIVALREVSECLESLGEMLAKAEGLKAGSAGEMLVEDRSHRGAVTW